MSAAAVLGFLGYGISLVLFVLALRNLGTARAGAYFSVAPFFGAALAILLFREAVTWQLIAAGTLMAVGVWLHLTEKHEHRHTHEFTHHAHEHDFAWNGSKPHAHLHAHEPVLHSHPYFPDIHHRHDH